MDTKYVDPKTGETLLIPGQITIEEYTYTKKDIYKKGICYRCQNRSQCSLTIIIEIPELKKIINKNKETEIKYTINSKQDAHTCVKKDNSKFIKNSECLTLKEIKELAKSLIKTNIDKDINFHIINFHKNKIFWNPKKIRRYVNNIIQEYFLKDEIFINNVLSTTIKYNDTLKNFCPSKLEFYDEDKDKYEKVICFSSNFQINLLKETNMLFIDGTFKSSPRNFYQILNIVGYLKQKDLFIPIFTALLTSKSEKIYLYALIEFQKLIDNLNLNIDFSKIIIMADFEINLREAIKKIFSKSEILGCYFHFIKNLYNKLKEIGLATKKKYKKLT